MRNGLSHYLRPQFKATCNSIFYFSSVSIIKSCNFFFRWKIRSEFFENKSMGINCCFVLGEKNGFNPSLDKQWLVGMQQEFAKHLDQVYWLDSNHRISDTSKLRLVALPSCRKRTVAMLVLDHKELQLFCCKIRTWIFRLPLMLNRSSRCQCSRMKKQKIVSLLNKFDRFLSQKRIYLNSRNFFYV